MSLRGQYRIWLPEEKNIILPTDNNELMQIPNIVLPNTIVDEGEAKFLLMLAQDDQTIIAGGANYYIGMMDQTPAEDDQLTDISTEPTVTNGYARKDASRDATGWPTTGVISGVNFIATKTLAFTASGGDFSRAFTRAFLCNVVSGTAGILFSMSGPLTTAVTVLNGETLNMRYELFLD